MDKNYDEHFERTIVTLYLSVSLRKLLYDSLFPSFCIPLGI